MRGNEEEPCSKNEYASPLKERISLITELLFLLLFSVLRSSKPRIFFAGRPYPLQNCTTYNLNGSLVRISCVEGYDGGLPQKFVAIVGKRRLESSIPSWEFPLLKPAKVALYAVNAKGSSEPYAIEVASKGVAKFTGKFLPCPITDDEQKKNSSNRMLTKSRV